MRTRARAATSPAARDRMILSSLDISISIRMSSVACPARAGGAGLRPSPGRGGRLAY
jgi:hypothetical protein